MSKLSSDFEWNINKGEEEVFDCVGHEFDIQKAKRIIVKSPRPVVKVNVANYSALLDSVVKLDRRNVTYDLSVPIIIGTLRNGGLLLLDGWHRVQGAVKEGVEELPAVILDKDETKRSRFRF